MDPFRYARMSVEKLNAEMWDPDTDPDLKVQAYPTLFGSVQASCFWHACVPTR